MGIPLAFSRWRTIFARQAFARAALARWAEASHVALHSASRVWFGQDPFPLDDSDHGLIFRIRATGADAVVRDGWAYVPDHHRRETVQVIWDGGPPASMDCADAADGAAPERTPQP